MARTAALKRKSFFVDEAALRRARRALGDDTDAEAIRLAVERVIAMERFWRFIKRTKRAVEPRNFAHSGDRRPVWVGQTRAA